MTKMMNDGSFSFWPSGILASWHPYWRADSACERNATKPEMKIWNMDLGNVISALKRVWLWKKCNKARNGNLKNHGNVISALKRVWLWKKCNKARYGNLKNHRNVISALTRVWLWKKCSKARNGNFKNHGTVISALTRVWLWKWKSEKSWKCDICWYKDVAHFCRLACCLGKTFWTAMLLKYQL